MSYVNKINTIIHPIASADFDNYIYNTIVATATSSIVVNGEAMTIPVGVVVNIIIRTLTGPSTGIILLGSPKNNYTASEML